MSEQQAALDALGTLDCAIIGGGVSGLYMGWRLRQEKPDWSVAICEQSDRTGGRLLTWLPYGKDAGLRAELGGMRFIQEQELVWNLIEHFGLTRAPFYVAGQNLLWYLRGQRMASGDANAASGRYYLEQGERGMQPANLIQHFINLVLDTPENQAVIRRELGGRPPTTRQDWDRIKPELTYKGRRLWDLGFWNILSDTLSYEGYQYASDAFGYYSLTANWNAAEAMQSIYLDFTSNPTYETLSEGYGQLPDTLHAEFVRNGGHVLLGHRLLSFDAGADGIFTLHFLNHPKGASPTEVVGRARRVVLAMPTASLTSLQASPTFNTASDERLKRLLSSVAGYPAFKLFLLYNERWWEHLGNPIDHGRSVCDLPIRQTYYFRPDSCDQPNSSDCPSHGLLMASYDDARAVDYWKGMEQPPRERANNRPLLQQALTAIQAGVFTGLTASANAQPDPPPQFHQAPQAMQRRATEQLALLHGVNLEDIPDPVFGAYADWSLEPWGGGWNFWQPQVDVRDVMTHVKKPLDNLDVYIVGEAYSGQQGWVEGALTTAELVLEQQFGLPRAEFIPQQYYLGW